MNEAEFLPINHLSDLFRNSIKSLMSEASNFPEWQEGYALNVVRVLITHGGYRINTNMIVSMFLVLEAIIFFIEIQLSIFRHLLS